MPFTRLQAGRARLGTERARLGSVGAGKARLGMEEEVEFEECAAHDWEAGAVCGPGRQPAVHLRHI